MGLGVGRVQGIERSTVNLVALMGIVIMKVRVLESAYREMKNFNA